MPGSPATSPNMGIPRYADADTAAFSAQVNGVTDVIDASAYIHQAGDLVVSCAASRAGCLLCDGSVVSETTYAALFSAIGSTYNTGGEGTGNFRLPDFRGRTIIGAGTGSGLTARSRGNTGGEENHTLTPSETAANLLNAAVNTVGTSNPGAYFNPSGTPNGFNYLGSSLNLNNAGSVSAHNNMQPYGVANVFIKT